MQGVVSKCRVPECSFFSPLDKKADCTITMADADLLAMMTGKMNPQSVSTMGQAFVEHHPPVYWKYQMN